MLTANELALLEAIRDSGSLSRAAVKLGRAPSSVSHAARQLEERFDALLFDRRRYRLQLTPAGQLLADEAARLMLDVSRLTQRVKQVASGWEDRLHIVSDEILEFELISPLIHAFDRLNSGVSLRLTHEVLGGTWEALREGRADLIVGATNEPQSMPNLQWAELGAMEWLFAVSPRHPLAKLKPPLRQDQIQQHRAVVVADTSRTSAARGYGREGGRRCWPYPACAPRSWRSATGWAWAGCRAIAWRPCWRAVSWWKKRPRPRASPTCCIWHGAAATRGARCNGGWSNCASPRWRRR